MQQNLNIVTAPQSNEQVPILRAQMLYVPQTYIFLKINTDYRYVSFYQVWRKIILKRNVKDPKDPYKQF